MHRKRINWAFVVILLVAVPLHGQQPESESDSPVPQIMNSKNGDIIELKELVADVAKQEVIVLGEQHDNDSGHEFQLNMIKALVEKGLDVVVSTEQFERDVQGAVDDYLADRITEEQFLKSSRPWKNYAKHYRPIIEFAKENDLPVLAGNVPRVLATSVSKDQKPGHGQAVFLPRSTTAPHDAYWENFEATMKGHIGNDSANKLNGFYKSQCVKDDAMAETITDYLAANRHRPKTVVHLCGHFHSDYGLGTVSRIIQRKPLVQLAVVTMESIPESGNLEPKDVRDRAHYILWTVKNNTASDADK